MKRLLYLFFFILLCCGLSCKNSISGCVDPNASNYNANATINDQCCYNCYTSLGYEIGEYCGYNLSFILENEFDGLVQCYMVNGDIVPASIEQGVEILDSQGEPVFWPYSSFNIFCN